MNEILPSGKYYLGDPTLVLHEKIILGIWGNLYCYSNGKFNIYGVDCAIHQTHKGDGTFTDAKNRKYQIISGVLSLVNVELIEDIELANLNGHVFEFENKVNFIYDAGLFIIKSGKKIIRIDTRDMNIYDSDYEEHCENEHGEYISKTIENESDDEDIQSIEGDSEKPSEKEVFNFFKKR